MKLLVDQNISHRILSFIPPAFIGSSHVRKEGLTNKDDYDIFMYARKNEFTAIVSLDHDFYNLISGLGAPPKIIWLRTGNCSTRHLGELLIRKEQAITSFLNEPDLDCLQIF